MKYEADETMRFRKAYKLQDGYLNVNTVSFRNGGYIIQAEAVDNIISNGDITVSQTGTGYSAILNRITRFNQDMVDGGEILYLSSIIYMAAG